MSSTTYQLHLNPYAYGVLAEPLKGSKEGEPSITPLLCYASWHSNTKDLMNANGVDMFNGKRFALGDEKSIHAPKLQAIMAALEPLINELRDGYLSLQKMLRKSEVELGKNQQFKNTWLEQRLQETFEHIQTLPLSKMKAAALTFKPDNVESYKKDVVRNGHILRLIPTKDLDDQTIIQAVTTTPLAIKWIPKSMRTADICDVALEYLSSSEDILEHFPSKMLSSERCLTAVMKAPGNVHFVPQHKKTPMLVAMACISSGILWDTLPGPDRSFDAEYCTSLHGMHKRSADKILDEWSTQDQDAWIKASMYRDQFQAKHFPDRHNPEILTLDGVHESVSNSLTTPSTLVSI